MVNSINFTMMKREMPTLKAGKNGRMEVFPIAMEMAFLQLDSAK